MRHIKQSFMFDLPAEDLLNKISTHPVHFFANAIDGETLMLNDLQAEILGASSINEVIGKNIHGLLPEALAKIIIENNINTINNTTPLLFHETAVENRECLSIKTQLRDTRNNIIGIGGIAFYYHQVALKDIVTLMNKLVGLHHLANNTPKHHHIFNANQFKKLSVRERECVYYLTRGMTFKEMAIALKISPRTIEAHINHIKNKLGCYSRSDIISMVFESKAL